MKKTLLVLVLCFVAELLFAQVSIVDANDPPLRGRTWTEDPYDIAHGGLTVSQWFRESSGRANVEGRLLTYFRYDTYYKNDGSAGSLFPALFEYVEKGGWVIDYANPQFVNPNPDLAESVKALMRARGCDISFTIIRDDIGDLQHEWAYFVINNLDRDKNTFDTVIFNIDRYYDSRGNVIR